jgi:hypothetical protein
MRGRWSNQDIDWAAFDAGRVDPHVLAAVKAAALVERNAADYVAYLHNVFADDAGFCAAATAWGEEEAQHGVALGRWAELADPGFDFAAAARRFTDHYRLPLDATQSVRGSRAGELIARCVVESGTSSLYSALRDATDEPVLKDICNRIAGDEFRHYKLFQDHFRRYEAQQSLGLFQRLRIALGRIAEAEDDELARAWWAANAWHLPYDRKRCADAYAGRVGKVYRYGHVRRAIGMVLKACNLDPQGRIADWAGRLGWAWLQHRNRRLGPA